MEPEPCAQAAAPGASHAEIAGSWAAVTADSMASVLGEDVREQTIVSVEGVPAGRTGAAGEVA
ncbi:hypothetical protein P1P75_07930 [Streptomyces sp. ID05-39B]|uniref:hypothetical protein n=1 Tax=Streptomyces sp. ID05-39B TaxID=3028664 RepID=UPI0029B503A1|nr:hypothetical protein [Streptomyces sp. ID05-39B]MDX3526370.1 hypothetical protein [Streptomyces sp. ID05-39B]